MARKPMTQDDIFQAKFVLGGTLSPNGDEAIYTLSATEGAGEEEKQITSLWRVNTAGGEPQQLTQSTGNETLPQYSPDGRDVYFLSDRTGVQQVYRMSLGGGEPVQVTALPQGATLYELSPNGKTVAFAALAAIPTPQGPNDHKRVTRAWWRMDAVGYLDSVAQAVHSMPSKGGKSKALTEPEGLVTALHWSPDGKELAYAVNAGPDQGFFEGAIRTAGGKNPRTIIDNLMVQEFFWLGNDRIGFAGTGGLAEQPRLKTMPAGGGRLRSHTTKSDLCVNGLFQINSPAARNPSKIIPAEDGKSVYCQVGEGGEGHVYNIAVQGRERGESLLGGARISTVLDGNDTHLLLAIQDHNTPPELYLFDIDTGTETQLSDHNGEWLSRIRLPEIERLVVRSAPGVEVEGWVLKPKHVRAPYKTVLYIHGGPHAAFGLSFQVDFQELVGAGYAVVYCNPRGSTGYGSDFSSAIIGCWGEPETEDFNAILNNLTRRGIANKDRLGVTGVSGGGHLSGWLMGHTNRFKAAIPEQGVYNMFSMWGVSDAGKMLIELEMDGAPHEVPERYWALSPLAYAHKCRTPTLLIQGENDIRCPMEQAEAMYQAIYTSGSPVELLRLNNCSHGVEIAGPPPLRRFRMDAILEWFDRYV
ncbi:MAG: S9 family peptidase [Pseudomonadales bacterium]|jgi:dipeptidyl aminopeptidase/acylaminoacyl peptidase|nr:S9 family peptidase [Kiritimatiellia bacterium]MDP6971702.1 S9 family peptidase [Pseudomonadales bacterium]